MNVFEAVKDNVTTREAAERYGLRVNRSGKTICPFHNDRNPSMKVDKRFHCFACLADGDVIDFVSRLFNLPCKAAAMKIADDFHIPYDVGQKAPIRPHIREPTPEQKYRQQTDRYYEALFTYHRLLCTWEKMYAPQRPDEEMHPLFVEALAKKDYIEYLLDEFLNAQSDEKKALVADLESEVMKIEQRIREAVTMPECGGGHGMSGINRQGCPQKHDQELPDRT